MLSPLYALILGVVQGLTEFFPVSSSAHLKLAKLFLGIEGGEELVLFDLVCHLGTFFPLIFFFKKEILSIFLRERQKLILVFVALLPLIPCYFLLKPLREWASKPELLGFFLMGTALLLFLGNRALIARRETLTLRSRIQDVLCIGAMQSAALIPGISRSASTLSMARMLGWTPQEAVRFSFLLAIPTIFAGNCAESAKLLLTSHQLLNLPLSSCLIGFFSSFGVGFLIIRPALSWLEKGNLKPFAWYCLLLGLLVCLLQF